MRASISAVVSSFLSTFLAVVILLAGARPALASKRVTNANRRPQQQVPGERPLHDYFEMLVDDGFFLPPLADIDAPTNYMRVYRASPVQHTTTPADYVGNGKHPFWDVGFGEEFVLLTLHSPMENGEPPAPDVRWPTGVAFFVDADMHMLLDFPAESSPVIDSEFHLGGGFMGRGVPWLTPPGARMSHFSWKLKFFHESTHIGDEYLDDVRKAQVVAAAAGTPKPGFVHPNVSYEAFEALVAFDGEVGPLTRCVRHDRPEEQTADPATLPAHPAKDSCSGIPLRPRVYLRGYAGYRRLLNGPYELDAPTAPVSPFGDIRITYPGAKNEGQVGGEARLRMTALNDVSFRWPDAVIAGAEMKVRRQYDFDNSNPSPRWNSFNVIAGIEWGDWANDQMVFRAFLNYYNGINPHGQFRAELLRYFGFTVQLDY